MKFGTKAIHAGVDPDPSTGAIMTPIFQTSTYVQRSPGDHDGFEYGRTHNPTRAALEKNLAALENGKFGICYSSGMAAMDAVLKLLKPGDEIIATNDLYGGSYRLIKTVFETFGLKGTFIDMTDVEALKQSLTDNTKLVWVETPTNPMLNIVDIAKTTEIAHEHGAMVCVDNTFASPYLQRPLDMGADMVLHSATKYLGGHSDVISGALITSDEKLADQLRYLQNAVGAVPSPFDCFLVLRGIKTLHLRVQRACDNARDVAQFLHTHPAVDKVYYPGDAKHPGHEIAKSQMDDFGGMVSFNLKKDTLEAASVVLSNTKVFSLAESLGGVESLIGHPATMTHASIPLEERLKVGMTESLIRLSVGIEDSEDLVADIDRALGFLS